MLTPEQLKIASELLSPVFDRFESFVIKDFARRIKTALEMTPTAGLQTEFGVAAGASLNEIVAEMQKALKISEVELSQMFKEMGAQNILTQNAALVGMGLSPIKISELPALKNIVLDIIYQTQGRMHNFSNSMGFAIDTPNGIVFKNIARFYQDAIDLAIFNVKVGVIDHNSAIKTAIKQAASSGLRTVDYKTGYSKSLESAIRSSVLTGLNQMSDRQNKVMAKAIGANLAEVTAHSGARPDHKIWQGRIYSIEGTTDKYRNLVEATGYGTVTGLMGANCRHNWFPYIEGAPRALTDEELKNIDPSDFEYKGKTYTHYEATQKQRAYERAIRKTKLECVGYDAAGLKDDFTASSVRLKDLEARYREFSKVAGINLKNERTQTVKFNKSISQKAVNANKAALDFKSAIGIKTSNDIDITGFSKHATERAKERKVYAKTINNALTNPIYVGKIKTNDGSKSQEFVGEKSRVTINPDTGNIITVWKTSERLRKKYSKGE